MKKLFGLIRNQKLTQISIYTILTVAVSFLLIHLIRHLDHVAAWAGGVLHFLSVILTPMAAGFAIAYLLYPVAGFLEKKLGNLGYFKKKGRSARGLAVACTMLAVGAVIIVLLSVVISAVSREARLIQASDLTYFLKTLAASIRGFFTELSARLDQMHVSSADISKMLDDLTEKLTAYAQDLASGIAGSISSLPGIFANILFAIIFGIYFLLDGKGLMTYWDRVLRAFGSEKSYREVHRLLTDADTVFSGYIRGQLIDAIIMANIVGVALSILRIKFAVMIGILVGIGNLIPYVGPFVAYVCTAIVCLVNGDIRKLAMAIIVLFLVQTIDGNVINPRLLSKNISVHPLLVIAALLLGSAIGGVAGMLLAVPIAALIKLQFDRAVDHLLASK